MARRPLSELRAAASTGPPFEEGFLDLLRADGRAGAQVLLATCMRRLAREEAAQEHLRAMMRFEKEAAQEGFERVAGVDEAGRGPLAGPVVAAAVVLSEPLAGLDDSKRLTPARRDSLFAALRQGEHSIGVCIIESGEIDRGGIQTANYAAMAGAAAQLAPSPDYLLVDGFSIPGCTIPHRRLIKGDRRSLSIAAASIIAKVTRDRIMVTLDGAYPEYGFAQHKGYGTADHLSAIERFGPCPAHRMSFAPMARSVETEPLFAQEEKDGLVCESPPSC
jgi:ribonuclease HII